MEVDRKKYIDIPVGVEREGIFHKVNLFPFISFGGIMLPNKNGGIKMSAMLTQAEANNLIETIKRTIERTIEFPFAKGGISFDAIAYNDNGNFVINIDRKGIQNNGCSYQGRIKSNDIILIRIDVNPTTIHQNPDGEKIEGTHIHVYREENGMKYAIPFDVGNQSLCELCCTFFDRFNIIDKPEVREQQRM